MIRFAIPPIGGKGWFGGWMYMANMVRALAQYGDPAIETVLFIGADRQSDPVVAELGSLPRTQVVIDPAFNEDKVRAGVGRTLLTGRNTPLIEAFARERIDVAFTPAMYLGWRATLPTIAWIPDFQHRHLPHLFDRKTWWRRDIGFRAQVRSSALLMLSSADSEVDAHDFYPASRGKTRVARFAVPIDSWPDADEAARIVRSVEGTEDYVFLPNQLWLHKNHKLAIDAAEILRQRGSTRKILVSGRGADPRRPAYPAELAAMIEARSLGDTLRMLGSVEHRLVQALTICANALVNPSRFEGWSTTVEEAKACGTPLLLSDIGVHREQAGAGARYFGTDDPEALADAIAGAPPRSLDQVRAAMAAARSATLASQRAFAETISAAVVEAAALRGG